MNSLKFYSLCHFPAVSTQTACFLPSWVKCRNLSQISSYYCMLPMTPLGPEKEDHLMFIGPCIIVIVEEWKTSLMSVAILFHFLCAQHVSDRCGNSTTQSQTPDVDILMSETCWTHKKWNKIATDTKLVFHSSNKRDCSVRYCDRLVITCITWFCTCYSDCCLVLFYV